MGLLHGLVQVGQWGHAASMEFGQGAGRNRQSFFASDRYNTVARVYPSVLCSLQIQYQVQGHLLPED